MSDDRFIEGWFTQQAEKRRSDDAIAYVERRAREIYEELGVTPGLREAFETYQCALRSSASTPAGPVAAQHQVEERGSRLQRE